MTKPNSSKVICLVLLVFGILGFSLAGAGAMESLAGDCAHDSSSEEVPLRSLYVKTVTELDKYRRAYCDSYEVVVDYLGEQRRMRQYHPVVNAVVKCDPEFLETPRVEITWRDYDEDTFPQLEVSYVKAWCEGVNGEQIAPAEVRLVCYERTIE